MSLKTAFQKRNKTVFSSFFLLALVVAFGPAKAQDPRVSLYESIPMLVNPALTGNTRQPVRLSLMTSKVSTGQLSNRISNVGVDAALGKTGNLGVGVNYMQSGSPQFAMSGSYIGVSLSQRFFLGKEKLHQIRIGGQVSLLKGTIDETKGSYNKYLDVRAFRYWYNPAYSNKFIGSGQYLNYSIGAYYRFAVPRFILESGFSAYNITNPLDHNIMPSSPVHKRYRATSLVSFTFRYNPANSFRFESFAWYEGLYLRDYTPQRDDTTNIHENTYSITWYRVKPKHPYSIGLYTRSLKSAYGVAAIDLSPSVKLAASYEIPFYKKYYGVRHLEVGTTIFPFKSKRRKIFAEAALDPLSSLQPYCPCLTSDKPQTKEKPLAAPKTKTKDTVYRVIYKVDTVYLSKSVTDTIRLRDSSAVPRQLVPAQTKTTDKIKDTDKDGIPDDLDKCPNAAGPASNGGCPADIEVLEGARATYIIYFDYDKSVLKPASVGELKLVRAALQKHPQARLVLTGHTDLNGTDGYNLQLSKRRVEAAAAFLRQNGVSPSIITTAFKGMRQPKIKDNTPAHAAINRRVEISLIY